jgi:hypothetical protein
VSAIVAVAVILQRCRPWGELTLLLVTIRRQNGLAGPDVIVLGWKWEGKKEPSTNFNINHMLVEGRPNQLAINIQSVHVMNHDA